MKIAFLFSGQGSQFPGMAMDLCNRFPESAAVFEEADAALGRGISSLCFEGTQEDLNLTHNTQPCMLAADLAAATALKAQGIVPDGAAGFSLGEYAALAFAGSLSFRESFEIIQYRADCMQEAVAPGEGAMAAMLGGSSRQIEAICQRVTEGYVVPANYNCPTQTVISGTVAGVDQAIALAREERIRGKKLAVSAPFHCALMEPAARKLETRLAECVFAEPSMPVYMNVDGRPVAGASAIPELLVKQAMSPVRWTETLLNMYADGFDTFVECGPGKTLSGLVSRTLTGVTVLQAGDLPGLLHTLEVVKDNCR